MIQPLSYRLRPENIDEFIGLEDTIKEYNFVKRCIEKQTLMSMIFYGQPGSGKTTLAICIANSLKIPYKMLNATTSSKKDYEEAIAYAELYGHIVLIIDEIHRLNKDKQDYFLSFVENGTITLIGATTANPFHHINPAIRSRCHLVEFLPSSNKSLVKILENALTSSKGLNNEYKVEDGLLTNIAKISDGDVRYALNVLEILSLSSKDNFITNENLKENIKNANYIIDKNEDGHYDAVSALQKSIRGSDVDASLYYLARLIVANDLDSIERRLCIIAYEDIGLANPQAIQRTLNALEVAKKTGFPEAMIPLGVAVVDLALSPKSRNACEAIENAVAFVKNHPLPVPKYLHMTPTGISNQDKYPYDRPDLWEKIQYLPDQVKNIIFYKGNPSSNYEKLLIENNKRIKSIKKSNKISELR